MSNNSLEYKAKIIADLIFETDTDYRGNLFFEVAIKLKQNSQYATAKMIDELAHTYGIKD